VETSSALAVDTRYVFQGVAVKLPVVVRNARAVAATFMVPSRAAREFLPDHRLEVVEVAPGKTLFTLGGIDYIDNDLGDYNEISMTFHVRAKGAPRGVPYVGAWIEFLTGRGATYIHRLPVDQSFTCDAGKGIWGFPKSVERVEFDAVGNRVLCRLDMDGDHVLTLDAPCGGSRTIPDNKMATYTYIDGVLHRTAFRSGAEGVGLSRSSAELSLGAHPVADELRALGLPKSPLMTVWMGRMRGRFEAPEPVV
jgi:hypothetical protein